MSIYIFLLLRNESVETQNIQIREAWLQSQIICKIIITIASSELRRIECANMKYEHESKT